MTESPALRVFARNEKDIDAPGQKSLPRHSSKQSGVRMALFAVQVARDTGFTSNEIINGDVTSSLVSRYPAYTRLSVPKQRMLLPIIEKFLSNGVIPDEDIIVKFLENICDAAAKLELPPEPHNGDNTQIALSAENEEEYATYLSALGHARRVLERIFLTFMAIHKATMVNLSNSE